MQWSRLVPGLFVFLLCVFPPGCSGGGGGGVGAEYSPPEVATIPVKVVAEGGTLVLDLAPYVDSPNPGALVYQRLSGPGVVVGSEYTYQDPTDFDSENDVHTVTVRVTDAVAGGATDFSFTVLQYDADSPPQPLFLYDKVDWVAYTPTNYDPDQGLDPTEASVRADLQALRTAHFDGLVTFGADGILGDVPRLAKEEGFKYVVMGIWDPDSAEEWANALAATVHADGYCLGNEGLLFGRYTLETLEDAIRDLRDATGLPVTTSEPPGLYGPDLLALGDWVFPNVHPYWNGRLDPGQAAAWTYNEYQSLRAAVHANDPLRLVVMKEVGLPTANDTDRDEDAKLSERNQADYYRYLSAYTRDLPETVFVHFEAFDQEWKSAFPVESHWGLFNSSRIAKEAGMRDPRIVLTHVPGIGSHDDLRGAVYHVDPGLHRVSVWILVAGTWWMKPTWADPLTPIAEDGAWVTDITTGGVDSSATEIYAAVVKRDYVPLEHTLPDLADPDVICETWITR